MFFLFFTGPWQQVNPIYWTKKNVLDWIEYHVDESKYDASLLNMECCFVDGATLCSQSYDTFLSMYGALGQTLFQSLERLRLRHGKHVVRIESATLSCLLR